MASWRRFADWAKHRPAALKLADQLGRGRGRMRFVDHLDNPPPATHTPDLNNWSKSDDLAAVSIGHASLLLRVAGMTILTDPVLSNKVGIGMGLLTAGPRRRLRPALSLHELPPLDLILVSHAHFDHLDRPTLCRLSKSVPVVTSEHNADLIRDLGFVHVTELRWNEHADVGPLRVTARQVRHWGARTFYDQHRGFAAFLLESLSGPRRRVLYGADTAYHTGFQDIGRVDLGIFGIGAYDPYVAAHATPEQAWAMANHVHADHVLPMHHSTFRLSHEPMAEPLERIRAAAGDKDSRLVAAEVGQQWSLN